MRYKLLGKSGLRVSELCLGTMTFGDERGWGSGKKESRDIYGGFIESVGNFFDTADLNGHDLIEVNAGRNVGSRRFSSWVQLFNYSEPI